MRQLRVFLRQLRGFQMRSVVLRFHLPKRPRQESNLRPTA